MLSICLSLQYITCLWEYTWKWLRLTMEMDVDAIMRSTVNMAYLNIVMGLTMDLIRWKVYSSTTNVKMIYSPHSPPTYPSTIHVPNIWLLIASLPNISSGKTCLGLLLELDIICKYNKKYLSYSILIHHKKLICEVITLLLSFCL